MGQKVHPIGFRLGTVKTWDSKWYAEKGYAQNLHEDLLIRSFEVHLQNKLLTLLYMWLVKFTPTKMINFKKY